ncbi:MULTISPECIES: anti-CBASS protein Acb1 family protein [Alcaligenes]|uniref:anti-CBASS protein Acb1 family protein n=1 Tax=Alcaligenes TaxID=507 RepID=UPI001EF0C304|nr:anti-CBASS Acb1 family protein [Alcaligenes faecalis]ULH08221.1 DUF1073 domain-containing protein [Alcaligenes faecalis]
MTASNLQLAVNHAMHDAALARARMNLLNPLGMGLDDKRAAAWCEYGFKQNLDFHDFYKLYRRNGLASGAVEKLAGTCWKTNPWVIEGGEEDESRKETDWEKKTKRVLTARLWRRFREADARRLVGRHSGLVLRVKDSGKWHEPVKGGSKALVDVVPVWAATLRVSEWNTDLSSENYGKPKFWSYVEQSTNGQPGRNIKIHPDRVFILGDYSGDAIGFLEPVYNNFVSLEKVEGGSGESFLKNAARQLNVNFEKEIDFKNLASLYGVKPEELREAMNEAAVEMNRANDVLLNTQGATVTPLVSTVPDPSPTYNINLQTISAGLDIPSRVLVGNQQGERASTEDLKFFYARCQSRRMDLSFEIEDLVDHLVRIGVLDATGEKTVMWDDLTEQTFAERLDNAAKMSTINQTALATGEEVFSNDEIRVAGGFDPKDSEPLDEGDDKDEDGDETETRDPSP